MGPRDRRCFDHFFAELSVALGTLVPRYALWLRLGETGVDPAGVRREQLLAFCELELPAFLADHQLALSERGARRLRRTVARFDPRHPTPYEHMARLGGSRGGA